VILILRKMGDWVRESGFQIDQRMYLWRVSLRPQRCYQLKHAETYHGDHRVTEHWTLARLKLLLPFVVLLSPAMIFVGLAQDQLIVDASKQPSPPATGRGPYTSSPGHFSHLPIRLELQIPSGPLQPDGTILVDFVITNRGFDVISLPSSTWEGDRLSSFVLNLWFTSDAVVKDTYSKDIAPSRPVKIGLPSLSAELYGRSTTLRASIGLLRTRT
jgi:hypothetical protein